MTEVVLNIHMDKAKVHCATIEVGTYFTAVKVGEVNTDGCLLFKSGLGIHTISGPGQGTTPAMITDNKWVIEYRPIRLVRMEFAKD